MVLFASLLNKTTHMMMHEFHCGGYKVTHTVRGYFNSPGVCIIQVTTNSPWVLYPGIY